MKSDSIITCRLHSMSRSLFYSVYVCPSSYYLQQWLLSPTFKQIGLTWLHAQGAIFIAESYGHAFMVILNVLQLIFCGWCTDWTDYRTVYNVIAVNYSTARCFAAPNKPCKWSHVLAKAIQLTAVQDVVVTLHVLSDFTNMLQWTNRNITIMISSLSSFMDTISCYTLHALLNF